VDSKIKFMWLKERISQGIVEIFLSQIEKGYKIEIKNSNYFFALNKNLTHPSLLYFNHQTGDDLLMMFYLLLKYLPQRKNVIIPTSLDYLRLLGKNPHYALGVRLAESILGYQMPAVIQSYRLTEENQKQGQELSLDLFLLLKNKLKYQGSSAPTVALFPEGHRSSTGKLLPAEEGLGLMIRIFPDEGLVLPVALRYPRDISPGLNYNPKIKTGVSICCGPLTNVSTIREQAESFNFSGKRDSAFFSHFLMWQLAKNLPEERRGVYRDDFLERTFRGDFELKINPEDNRVGVWDKVSNSFLPDIY
jgi:1-acyl-sn-glycerol-3-phosphate acyltransferase